MEEQYNKEELKNLEKLIRAKIEKSASEFELNFQSQAYFEKRKNTIYKIYMMKAKAGIKKTEINILREEARKKLDAYKFNQSELTEFQENQAVGIKDFIRYLDFIEKPLEKTLTQYSGKVSKSLKSRIATTVSTMKDLVHCIKEVYPMKIKAIKEEASKEIKNDENEIKMLEQKFQDLEALEEKLQNEINSIEAAIENDVGKTEEVQKAIIEMTEKNQKCQELQTEIEKLKTEYEKCKQTTKEYQLKREDQLKINMLLTEKVSGLENNFEQMCREDEAMKKTITSLEKKVKFLKSKAGNKTKLKDIEADSNYKDAINSTMYQEYKENITRLHAEGEQILNDTKNIQEKYAEEVNSLENLKELLGNLKSILSQNEIDLQQAKNDEEQKLSMFEELKKEIESIEIQNKEKIESLKKTLEIKTSTQTNIENDIQKLIELKNSIEEAEKQKNTQELEFKRKTARHSIDSRKENSSSQEGNFAISTEDSARPGTPRPEFDFNFKINRPAYMLNLPKFDFPNIELKGEDENDAVESESIYGSEIFQTNHSTFEDDEEM